MVSLGWILVIVLIVCGSVGPKCAAADEITEEDNPAERIPDISDSERNSAHNTITADYPEKNDESQDYSSNRADDHVAENDDGAREDQIYPNEKSGISGACPSGNDNSDNSDCDGKHAPEDDSTGEESATGEAKEEAEADKSRTKLFSLSSVIRTFFGPFMQEFREAMTDKEVANTTEVFNITIPGSNVTVVDDEAQGDKNVTDSRKKFKFNCTGRNVTENTTAAVEIVNSTVLLDVLSFSKNKSTSDCVLVMFFAPWCQFCAKTAPHFNALGRAFPQLEVLAVDAVHFSNLNARFGTVAVPNLMLFHQSRSAIRFNHTERNFDMFVQFVKNVTGLEPDPEVNVTEADWEGPLSSVPTEETDYLLLLAWLFVIACSGWMFVNSQVGQCAINKVRQLWQEHQHIE